jgi:hypothetical protein
MIKHLIPPHLICEWLGHSRELYRNGYYHDRRGRERERWHNRCKRCGTSDGGEVFREGRIERFRGRGLRSAFRRQVTLWKFWWREDCEDCRKPRMRVGRSVGDHARCEVIPF